MTMNSTVSLSAHGVSLELPLYLQSERSAHTWFSMLAGAAFDRPRREFRTILSDISFNAQDGDRIGIIGRNGVGKSTLLRVLTGAYQPTQGRIEAHGSMQALLNISLGFSGEATVRENIFLRGTAMGLRAAEIREIVLPVLEFAEIEDKANHRLKTLSSGQRMRLGFSIATAAQHDIMIMDEWIGTGDAAFITKAKKRMQGRVDGAKIVLLASHNVALIKNVCNKGLLMDAGRVVFFGDTTDALKEYKSLVSAPAVTEKNT
ncbi:ABC-2 type transport system ATP-binding protein/lipopolysaccharide transport system ATP-binding protein [Luteimonas cucumeris]|uniref:ABC-2 type transport system ATP-binding protein/lipopolysaccharide transport system ATP-binding protein n=1 Tax=Luteimonas cucumeris TaxID=985012 RepID=A0A562L5T9_9GAMM|nr:ATP-binding cassette domain-containing protein [Luteimonas cucumeris]TWI02983.1 ABC-2 type transport system ATP-binding protein/lipopolysaccharide transport system ATP-binding protein [Luteimonas cucumeris]